MMGMTESPSIVAILATIYCPTLGVHTSSLQRLWYGHIGNA